MIGEIMGRGKVSDSPSEYQLRSRTPGQTIIPFENLLRRFFRGQDGDR